MCAYHYAQLTEQNSSDYFPF